MYQITAHRVQPVETPIAHNQRVQKLWVVGGAAGPLQRLTLKLPGAAHVSYCKLLDGVAAAHIRVSSDSAKLIERLKVVQSRRSNAAIKVTFASKFMSSVKGSLLVEVMLAHPEQLQYVKLKGSGDAVIEDRVLATNAPAAELKLNVRGSGNLFASSSTRVDINKLELSVRGSGDVQLIAPAVVAHSSITAHVMSSGDIRMFASTIDTQRADVVVFGSGDAFIESHAIQIANELGVGVLGSGDAFVFSDAVTTTRSQVAVVGSGSAFISSTGDLRVEDMRVSTAGSGDIKLYSPPTGLIAKLNVSAVGSGLVDTADVLAVEAEVDVTGSEGRGIVRARDLLKASIEDFGDVTYVNEVPREIKSKKTLRHTVRGPQEPMSRMLPLEAPTRADSFERTFKGGIIPFSFNLFSSGSASAHPAPVCPPAAAMATTMQRANSAPSAVS